MKAYLYKAERGYNIIVLCGIMLIILAMSVFSVDLPFYFGAQNQLQTAADAAALSATQKLFRSQGETPEEVQDEVIADANEVMNYNFPGTTLTEEDVIFGYIDPDSSNYDPDAFTEPSDDPNLAFSGGYNSVQIVGRRGGGGEGGNAPLPSIMANFLGIESMATSAMSVSLLNNAISSVTDGGIRPIYSCQGQVDLAFADNNPEGHTARVYGDKFYIDGAEVNSDCPAPGSGNWGFADLSDCSPGAVGNNTLADWFENGYPGTVEAGECYSTQPGNSISSNNVRSALDGLIANETVNLIPVFDSW